MSWDKAINNHLYNNHKHSVALCVFSVALRVTT